MLVDSMTKNMRDVLIIKMMSTGQWCPDESEVHVASDVFFSSDPVADCVRNGCYCVVNWQTPSPWWHLPVCECLDLIEVPDCELVDAFASVFWNSLIADADFPSSTCDFHLTPDSQKD